MDYDVIIIGGGIVGIACAASCSAGGFRTLLVERHGSFGQEASSRNSEVIHSGLYYQPDSWRARLCVPGNRNMYGECERLGVWAWQCGKLVVAVTPDEEPDLEALFKRGTGNGVPGLELLSTAQTRRLEPNIRCRNAIWVPTTGLVDSHALMKGYLQEAQAHGADCAFGVEFRSVADHHEGYVLRFRDTNGEETRLSTRFVVNAAGISAGRIAEAFGIDIDAAGYRVYPNRGHYYRVSWSKSTLVSRLVYPVPPKQMSVLGIHITVDKAGQVRLGPDAEYIPDGKPEQEWYQFDDNRREKFYDAVSRYFPALELNDLSPDQVGVRAKIQAPGEPVRDFVICHEKERGLPGLVNLVGIESPGLTCSHEIAGEVVRLLRNN